MFKNRYQHFSCLSLGSRSFVDADHKISDPSQFGCIYMELSEKSISFFCKNS